jgi:hypothetical protein
MKGKTLYMHKITTNQQLEEGKWKIKWKRRGEGRSLIPLSHRHNKYSPMCKNSWDLHTEGRKRDTT